YLKDHVAPASQLVFDDRARSAVIMSVHDRPFEKLAACARRCEFFGRDEKIVDAMSLTCARRACRPRDRITEARHFGEDAPDERALAAARRRTDDKQNAALAQLFVERRALGCNRLVIQRSAPARAIFPLPP